MSPAEKWFFLAPRNLARTLEGGAIARYDHGKTLELSSGFVDAISAMLWPRKKMEGPLRRGKRVVVYLPDETIRKVQELIRYRRALGATDTGFSDTVQAVIEEAHTCDSSSSDWERLLAAPC